MPKNFSLSEKSVWEPLKYIKKIRKSGNLCGKLATYGL